MAQAGSKAASSPSDIVQILGGWSTWETKPRSRAELRDRILDGLPYAALESVMRGLHLDRTEVCEALHLSPRTFSRRKAEGRLQPDESDRLYRLARIGTRATEVLGDAETASRWLHRANRSLGGEAPLRLLSTDLGSRQVEQVLGRIEHGVIG